MTEELNAREVSIKEFLELIREDLEEENYNPIIGFGKVGVGKTVSLHQLTQELNIGYCELRLVTLTEMDMLGLPYDEADSQRRKGVDEDNVYHATNYASNEALPRVQRDGEVGILVLDEITSASPTVRAAAYQLLDSKRALGNYKLPPRWKVVAIGNGINDGGVFNGMEAGFLSRGKAVRIGVDPECWVDWAIRNEIHPAITGYIKFDPSKIHTFDPDNEEIGLIATPRSWTALSDKLKAREKITGGVLPDHKVSLYAATMVGDDVGSAFAAFYAYSKNLLSPEDILTGRANGADVRNFDKEAIYIMIQALIQEVKRITDAEVAKGHSGETCDPAVFDKIVNVCKWAMDAMNNGGLDYGVMLLQDLSSSVPEFTNCVITDAFDAKCPGFVEVAIKNRIMLGTEVI